MSVWGEGLDSRERARPTEQVGQNGRGIPMNERMTVKEAAQPDVNATELSTGRFIVVGFNKENDPMGWIEGESVDVKP